MTVKRKCTERVWNEIRRIYLPCRRPATVQHNSQWYCWQHDPEYIEAKAEERRAAWKAKGNREDARYKRIARNARLGALVTEETAALLEQLATHVPYTPHTGVGIAMQARTLAARIREVLALEVNDENP